MEINTAGHCTPLGASYTGSAWNFAIISPHLITHVILASYDRPQATKKIPLDHIENRTGNLWHVSVPFPEESILYGFVVENERTTGANVAPIVFDPYAKLLKTGCAWGKNIWHELLSRSGKLISVATVDTPFPWSDLSRSFKKKSEKIIYEAHIRGMTNHPSSDVLNRGTFLGCIDKLDHLVALGVNTLELLPVFEWDETENIRINPKTKKPLYNYWGYSPLSFFSPMQRYGTTENPLQTANELKQLVQACHERGIQVVLDVVYNHTGEGNEQGPSYSYKLLDQDAYYLMDENGTSFSNYSGCGNTINGNHPIVTQLILDSLRHYVVEYHIDGFRFDLAAIFTRNQRGMPINEPHVLQSIAQDPLLSETILITEPWDAVGLYQTGYLYNVNSLKKPRFAEWNDQYRDAIRKYIKGTFGTSKDFATRIAGSNDLYKEYPLATINFITAHDGFSLYDCVSYDTKHNEENGEDNTDGTNANYSWNCGHEGTTTNTEITALRRRQILNFFVALLTSFGTPMILMGDEYGATRDGNNNSWCQDTDINYFNWNVLKNNPEYANFIKTLIEIREESHCFHADQTGNTRTIFWHGENPYQPLWDDKQSLVAYTIADDTNQFRLFAAFNPSNSERIVTIPPLPHGMWHALVRTSDPAPKTFFHPKKAPRLSSSDVILGPYSSLLLGNLLPPSKSAR